MRLSELYVSVQGEGPRVGLPTIFVRMGGCNLRCALWPCDTPYAVDPKVYRNEWEQIGPTTLPNRITQLAAQHGIHNICFTGGEPFLQPKGDMNDVISFLEDSGYHLEAFTNGTIKYTNIALAKVDMVMDWKLPGSGEDPRDVVRIYDNLARMVDNPRHAVKFTIANYEDYLCAKHIWEDYLEGHRIQVFAGVVWDKLDNKTLVEWILSNALPWRHTMQVHNLIWDRSQRAI